MVSQSNLSTLFKITAIAHTTYSTSHNMYSHSLSSPNSMFYSFSSRGRRTAFDAQPKPSTIDKALAVNKARRLRARRRNSVVIHRRPTLSPTPKSARSLAPKKKIRARFAGDDSSSSSTQFSPVPVSPQTPLVDSTSHFRSISLDEISVVSQEEMEDKAKVVSDQDLSTSTPPPSSIGGSSNTVWSSPSTNCHQRRNTPKVTPVKKTRTTKKAVKFNVPTKAEEEAGWMAMFGEFVAYKTELAAYRMEHHGATQYSPKDLLFLTYWVKVQRKLHARNRLSERRTKLLESVGFVW